jgi:hypothetical protein
MAAMSCSDALHDTMASIDVCRLQRLGPRRARTRDISMDIFLLGAAAGRILALRGALLIVAGV